MRCFLRLLGEQGTRGRLAWLAPACPGVLGAPARSQAVAVFLLAGARGGSLASVRVGGQVTVQKQGPQGPCTSGVAVRKRRYFLSFQRVRTVITPGNSQPGRRASTSP